MNTQWPPDPDPIREFFISTGVAQVVRDLLAAGSDAGLTYQERNEWTYDGWLHSMMARKFAWEGLQASPTLAAAGIKVVPGIAMCGLHLRHPEYEVKILRAHQEVDEDGDATLGLPPSRSIRRQRYYRTPPPMFGAGVPLSPLPLVWIWDTDEDHQLSTIEIALPKGQNVSRNCVDTWWLLPLFDLSIRDETSEVSYEHLDDHDVRKLARESGQAAEGGSVR